ncbi:alpha,alpha-trehalase nth1, partial [Nowakowskiella sp. JEL0078]
MPGVVSTTHVPINMTSVLQPLTLSNKDKFLMKLEDAARPSEALRHVNQIEKELDYPDSDHKYAHGFDSTIAKNSLTRNRSMNRFATDQDRGRKYTEEDREKQRSRRRGSQDETLIKSRKFLIEVEVTIRESHSLLQLQIELNFTGMILALEDTDGDFQITVHDSGPKQISLGSANSQGFRKYDIRGTYIISNLLQELALASDYGRKFIVLDEERLNENPVERITRLVKYHFWDALTRRIDAEGLELICNDPKNKSEDKCSRVFVPFHDKFAFRYYTRVAETRSHLNIEVIRLPEIITPRYVKSLNTKPGILALSLRTQAAKEDSSDQDPIIRGVPFVVPGGRFNEMYGWDSFFETLGLLHDGRVELARGMVDNFIYEIAHYGKILNANRTYYLTRSQPPFLTEMINEVHRHLNTSRRNWKISERKAWLNQSFRAAIKEILSIWLSSPRLDPEIGLSKYYPEGVGMPPETEDNHFDHILEPFAKNMGLDTKTYGAKYAADEIIEPQLDRYFVHDRAVRESGHDTTYRFENRCSNLATVDLNMLVFKYEVDIAKIINEEFGGSFKLRVRRGPEDIYLKNFLEWHNLIQKKGIENMIGRGGGWDSMWAKGTLVFDEAIDREIRDWVNTILRETGHEPDSTPETLTEKNDVNNSLETLNYKVRDPPIDHSFPTYLVDEDSTNPYFTVRLPATLFVLLADRTRSLVNKFLWNPQARMFFDYDCEREEQSVYETVTTLWALWAGLPSEEQAAVMVPRALTLFEVAGGLVCGTEESRGRVGSDRPNRQWDYPYGWAPHQMMAWAGLIRYGFVEEARRCAYRWLFTICKTFVDFNGVIPEKFDVVNMTHKFNVEYGNVGSDFKLVVREGFGWMNASFVVSMTTLG